MKIDKNKLIEMRTNGVSQKEMAKDFGCSIAAVSKMIKSLTTDDGLTRFEIEETRDGKKGVVVVVPAKEIGKTVSKINYLEQLLKINDKANQILDDSVDKPKLAISAMSEIRSQLKLQIEIFQTMYDAEAIQRFHDEVTQIIGEASPELRAELLKRLNEGREALI